jgi:hypothetical protein
VPAVLDCLVQQHLLGLALVPAAVGVGTGRAGGHRQGGAGGGLRAAGPAAAGRARSRPQCPPTRRPAGSRRCRGLRNTTRSPVAIRPGRATVSAVRHPAAGPLQDASQRPGSRPCLPGPAVPGPSPRQDRRQEKLARICETVRAAQFPGSRGSYTNLPTSGASPLSHARQPQLQIVTSAADAGRHQALPARGSAPIAAFRRGCPGRAVRWPSRSGS